MRYTAVVTKSRQPSVNDEIFYMLVVNMSDVKTLFVNNATVNSTYSFNNLQHMYGYRAV